MEDKATGLGEIREKCGGWDEDLGMCLEDNPGECPYHVECQKEAESEDGE